jgi:hypothetical protein
MGAAVTARAALLTALDRALGKLEGALAAKTTDTSTYGGEFTDHISADHWTDIYEAVYDYLTSDESITRARNIARKAVVNNFPPAFYSGYADGGGEETEDDDERWLTDRINTEQGFVDAMFASLKDKRVKLTKAEADVEASTRADGYRNTIESVYSEGKLRGSKNKTLEFGGEDGADSCDECVALVGTRHTVKWILANDMIPRPGNTKFGCKGYKCQHFWFDPKTGERMTL